MRAVFYYLKKLGRKKIVLIELRHYSIPSSFYRYHLIILIPFKGDSVRFTDIFYFHIFQYMICYIIAHAVLQSLFDFHIAFFHVLYAVIAANTQTTIILYGNIIPFFNKKTSL